MSNGSASAPRTTERRPGQQRKNRSHHEKPSFHHDAFDGAAAKKLQRGVEPLLVDPEHVARSLTAHVAVEYVVEHELERTIGRLAETAAAGFL